MGGVLDDEPRRSACWLRPKICATSFSAPIAFLFLGIAGMRWQHFRHMVSDSSASSLSVIWRAHSSSSRLGEYASRSSRTEIERLNRGYAVRSIDAATCALASPQSDMNERYRNWADRRCVGELRIVFTRESTSEIPGSSSLRSGCQPTAGRNTRRDAGLMRRPRSTHGRFRTYLGRPR